MPRSGLHSASNRHGNGAQWSEPERGKKDIRVWQASWSGPIRLEGAYRFGKFHLGLVLPPVYEKQLSELVPGAGIFGVPGKVAPKKADGPHRVVVGCMDHGTALKCCPVLRNPGENVLKAGQ